MYQSGSRSTEMLLSKAPFARLLLMLVMQLAPEQAEEEGAGGEPLRFTRDAVECLMYAAEAFLVELFVEASLYTLHAKRVTMLTVDIELAKRYFRLPCKEQVKASAAAAVPAAAVPAAAATDWVEGLPAEDPENSVAGASLIGDK